MKDGVTQLPGKALVFGDPKKPPGLQPAEGGDGGKKPTPQ